MARPGTTHKASEAGHGSLPTPSLDAPTTWNIWVSGYGEFTFEGTEAEADEMRSHKARWERGNGQKWRADLARESDRLTAEIVDLWATGQGCPSSLLAKRGKARDAERGLSPEAVYRDMPRGWRRSREIAVALGFTLKGTLKALRKLRGEGRVECSGPDWRRIEPTPMRGSEATVTEADEASGMPPSTDHLWREDAPTPDTELVMGTRAQFFIGDPRDVEGREWLGCIAWDGYPDGDCGRLAGATTEAEFRNRVELLKASRDDFTDPAIRSFPFPWRNNLFLTDWTYAWFGGEVQATCYHRGFVSLRRYLADPAFAEGYHEGAEQLAGDVPAPVTEGPRGPDSIMVLTV